MERSKCLKLQLFATDINAEAVDIARIGLYPEKITADVTPERLRRFFTKVEQGYRTRKEVRDAVVFAVYDLNKAAPFTRLDILVCRNLLDATEIAIIFLDNEIVIKRFTPPVHRIIPLLPADVGRPITHFASSLRYERLAQDMRQVLDRPVTVEAASIQTYAAHPWGRPLELGPRICR